MPSSVLASAQLDLVSYIAKLRPSPTSAKLAWLSLYLISSRYVAEYPPDMWQKIAQICGRRSPRYVAEDHPYMWQKITHPEKYIFQQAAMKISTPFQTKPSHILKIDKKNFQVFGSITFSFRGARSALPKVNCCQSLFSANTAIHPYPQSVGYHIVIISKAKAKAPSPQPVRQNIASAKHNSANLVLSLAQLSPSLLYP